MVADEALARDLDYIELGMNELLHDNEEVLEETALRALEIPEAMGAISFEDGERFSPPSAQAKVKFLLPQPTSRPLATLHWSVSRNLPNFPFFIMLGEDSESGLHLSCKWRVIPLAAERKALDGKLIRQGLFAFTGGGGLILVVFMSFLRRLRRSREALAEKSQKLAETNRRLAQACKAAGVGAVTSHLDARLEKPIGRIA